MLLVDNSWIVVCWDKPPKMLPNVHMPSYRRIWFSLLRKERKKTEFLCESNTQLCHTIMTNRVHCKHSPHPPQQAPNSVSVPTLSWPNRLWLQDGTCAPSWCPSHWKYIRPNTANDHHHHYYHHQSNEQTQCIDTVTVSKFLHEYAAQMVYRCVDHRPPVSNHTLSSHNRQYVSDPTIRAIGNRSSGPHLPVVPSNNLCQYSNLVVAHQVLVVLVLVVVMAAVAVAIHLLSKRQTDTHKSQLKFSFFEASAFWLRRESSVTDNVTHSGDDIYIRFCVCCHSWQNLMALMEWNERKNENILAVRSLMKFITVQ